MEKCPEISELGQLVQGAVACDRFDELILHVDSCRDCQAKLTERDWDEDSFVCEIRISDFKQESWDASTDEMIIELLEKCDVLTTEQRPQLIERRPAPPIDRIGPYEIKRVLGSGGMGTVYLARHTRLNRDIALKVLKGDQTSSEQFVERFEREMRVLGALHHPNIVKATDADHRDGYHYIAMELVRGEDLRQIVKAHGPLDVPDACALISQAAEGLAYAHKKGLVHRDIKPSNIMLEQSPDLPEPVVKLLDLGLALCGNEIDDEQLTMADAIVGTPDYLAPEQWENTSRVDIRADLYSLGCTLFYLLAGRAPFDDPLHRSTARKMKAHLVEKAPSILQIRPDIPRQLDNVIARTLEKRPEKRPGDPTQLVDELKPFTQGSCLSILKSPDDHASMDDTLVLSHAQTISDAEDLPRTDLDPVRAKTIPWLWVTAGICLLIAGIWGIASQIATSGKNPQSPIQVLKFEVKHFRTSDDQPKQDFIGLARNQHEAVFERDELRLNAELSHAGYCYLLAFNPDGSIQQCWPNDDQQAEQSSKLIWPVRPTIYFQLTDGPGQQAFVLLVSRHRQENWAKQVRDIPATLWGDEPEEGVWIFADGQLKQIYVEDERNRGSLVEHTSHKVSAVTQYFRSIPGIDDLRCIAFPVRSLD